MHSRRRQSDASWRGRQSTAPAFPARGAASAIAGRASGADETRELRPDAGPLILSQGAEELLSGEQRGRRVLTPKRVSSVRRPRTSYSPKVRIFGRLMPRRRDRRDSGPPFPREEDQLLARFRLMPAEAIGRKRSPAHHNRRYRNATNAIVGWSSWRATLWLLPRTLRITRHAETALGEPGVGCRRSLPAARILPPGLFRQRS